MYHFKDYYYNNVAFSTGDHPFSKEPKHVWIISQFDGSWLLTRHATRGLEFPGGKVEEGETPEDAARREVFEETGGMVEKLYYIGQYRVDGKSEIVIKNVYFAEISNIITKIDYLETKGPKLIKTIPTNIRTNKEYSFIMKDDVLEHSLREIERRCLIAKG